MAEKKTKQKKSGKKSDRITRRKQIAIATVVAVAVLCILVVALVLANQKNGADKEPVPSASQEQTTVKTEQTLASPEEPKQIGPTNLLTGEPCDEATASKRPVAVMINNIYAAWPQYNTSQADIIYECEVEGGLTRLLAVYSDVEKVEDSIGSVRSAREYYLDFASNHDALFVHAGGAESAYTALYEQGTDHLDGVNGGAETNYYVRDPRRSGMAYEHRLCISGPNVIAAAKARGLRTDATAFENPMQFVSDGEDPVAQGNEATYVVTPFSATTAYFTYDAASKKYLRFEYNTAQTDGLNGEQLSFDNLIVLFCPYTNTGDSKGHITVDTLGSGDGYYINRGKYIPIHWNKTAHTAPISLKRADDGTALQMQTGKTFISVINTASRDRVTMTQ